MYFQAHHLMDVTIGGLCAALMGLLFEFVSTGLVGDVCTMPRQWWEPAAAFGVLVVWAKGVQSEQRSTRRKRSSERTTSTRIDAVL